MPQEIDHSYTQEIVCPHCGNKHGDSWEIDADSNLGQMQCDDCEKNFKWERNVEVTYSTEKA